MGRSNGYCQRIHPGLLRKRHCLLYSCIDGICTVFCLIVLPHAHMANLPLPTSDAPRMRTIDDFQVLTVWTLSSNVSLEASIMTKVNPKSIAPFYKSKLFSMIQMQHNGYLHAFPAATLPIAAASSREKKRTEHSG